MKNVFRFLTASLAVIMILSATSCFKNNSTSDSDHECESYCETCGGCKDLECADKVCESKCDGKHLNLPDINVGDLK